MGCEREPRVGLSELIWDSVQLMARGAGLQLYFVFTAARCNVK